VVRGYFAYYAVPTNIWSLAAFRYHVTVLWCRTLRRRSHKDWTARERISRLVVTYLQYLPPRESFIPGRLFVLLSTTRDGSPGARIVPTGFRAGGAR
jgi:hypothetical protein